MSIKLAILFLGALLLAQTTYSAPVDSAEKLIDDLAAILKGIAERFTILEVTIDELVELDELVKEKGNAVLKKVLEDPKVLEVKSDAMKKILNDIREYVDKVEKGESGTEKNILEYLNFEDLVNKFKKEKVENIAHEAEIIGTSLKENGLEEFEKAVTEHFEKFVKKFTEQIDEYIKKLTEEEKKDEKIIIDWYHKFVDEKDISKKLSIFDDFFVSQNNESKEKSKEE